MRRSLSMVAVCAAAVICGRAMALSEVMDGDEFPVAPQNAGGGVSVDVSGAEVRAPEEPPVTLGIPSDPEPAAAEAPAAKPGFIPGGIADAGWKTAYIQGPSGCVEAIDLATGKLLFASATQARPLAVSGDRVFVLTPTVDRKESTVALRVVAMSISGQGKYVCQSAALPVPAWVASGNCSSLLGVGRIDGGKLVVSWAAVGTGAGNENNGRFQRFRGGKGCFGGEVSGNAMVSATGSVTLEIGGGALKLAAPATTAPAAETPLQPVQPGQPIQAGVPAECALQGAAFSSPAWNYIAPAEWVPLRVSHSGVEYSLRKAYRGFVLSAQNVRQQRTLWERPVSPRPGEMPTDCGSGEPPAVNSDLQQQGQQVMIECG